MDRNKLNRIMVCMLVLVGAGAGEGRSSGETWALVEGSGHCPGVTFDDYTLALSLLTRTGQVQDRGHWLTLTPEGRALHAKVTA